MSVIWHDRIDPLDLSDRPSLRDEREAFEQRHWTRRLRADKTAEVLPASRVAGPEGTPPAAGDLGALPASSLHASDEPGVGEPPDRPTPAPGSPIDK